MTLETTRSAPEAVLFLVDSKGTAHPDSLAPFTHEREGRHWLLRDGMRRKSVLAGETFQWDGMTFVVLEASDQPCRLQMCGASGRNPRFHVAVSGLPTLARSLARMPAARAFARVEVASLVAALCLVGGRYFAPEAVAFAPAFEQTRSSVEAHRLFHRLSLLPVAPPSSAPVTLPLGTEPVATHTAAPNGRKASSDRTERPHPRERALQGDLRRGDEVPSRFFLTPGD